MPRIRKDQTKHQNEEERRHLENIEGTAEATANTQKTRGNTKIGGHIENLRKGGSIFVNPPKILKRQLTGYCTSPASSPMGRDNTNTVGMKSMRNLWQSPQDLCHLSFLLETRW